MTCTSRQLSSNQQKALLVCQTCFSDAQIVWMLALIASLNQGFSITSILAGYYNPARIPNARIPPNPKILLRPNLLPFCTSLRRNLLPFCISFAPESSAILHLFCARIFCHFAPLLRPNLLSFCISFAPEPSTILHVFAPEFAHRLYRPLNALLQPHYPTQQRLASTTPRLSHTAQQFGGNSGSLWLAAEACSVSTLRQAPSLQLVKRNLSRRIPRPTSIILSFSATEAACFLVSSIHLHVVDCFLASSIYTPSMLSISISVDSHR
jgi:hypothetical protein